VNFDLETAKKWTVVSTHQRPGGQTF